MKPQSTTDRPLAGVVLVLGLSLSSCAQIAVQRQLQATALEPARTVVVPLGPGLAVRGVREGTAVRATVLRIERCADESHQRARGYEVMTRRAVGYSLLGEWLLGSLVTATGVTLLGLTAAYPPEPGVTSKSQTTAWLQAGTVTALGLGLLAGAVWDQSQIGTVRRDLGERELRKRLAERTCSEAPAPEAQVRLTLPDGEQLLAVTNQDGVAVIALPSDLELRLEKEGSRRATLEATGDVRAQVRIGL